MPLVRLVCWKRDVGLERGRALKEGGFLGDASPLETGRVIGHFRANPPSAVLIDLDRLPSHGREVAVALRTSKSTRHIPIVFAGGLAEKVERIRGELPDAEFTGWSGVVRSMYKELLSAPAEPVQPVPHMQRYAGTSLVKKLGIAAKMKAAVLGAPEEFAEKLGELPEGVEMQTRLTKDTKLRIGFVRSRQQLESDADWGRQRWRSG